ncbi:MAG: hydrogenase iron-sulfur subunit [Desulfobaccales bacterium]
MAGCHNGECHYLTGNIRAKKMGLEPGRLEMFNVGSAEG